MVEERVQRRLAAILAADVAGYSRLMGEDEEGTLAALTAHRTELIKPCIAEYNGRVVKTTGDGLLAEFASVVDAVRCAVAFQEGMRERNADVPEGRRIEFRIGVNLGDILVDDDDVYGDGVNVAARLEGLANPGSVCVSEDVYRQCRGKLEIEFDDLGKQQVKNIAEPVHTYRVFPKGRQVMSTKRRSALSRWSGPTITATFLFLIVAGGLEWWQPWTPDVQPALVERMAFPLPDEPSVAVLHFVNMSGDKEQEYFADGLTEDIITSLARFPNLFVIARHSTRKFKGKAMDIREVAQDLGVRYVVEGSVRRSGGTVRITAQLIDALTGKHIWANKYDRELKDIFALQDEITGEIGARLVSKVVAAEFRRRSRKGSRSPEAYDMYLRGWDAVQVLDRENVAQSIQLFEQAIENDPDFARAYANLALARSFNVRFGWAKGPKDTFSIALDLALKAVALDPRDAFTHEMLGAVHRMQGHYDRAVAALETAVTLGPNNPDVLIALAFALAFASRSEEAVNHAEKAMRLNPHAPSSYWNRAGIAYYMNGNFDKAVMALERARELNPRFDEIIFWLAASYAELGRMEEARAAKEAYLLRQPKVSVHGIIKRNPARGKSKQLIIDGYRKAGFPE